jgi:hypothetical protein
LRTETFLKKQTKPGAALRAALLERKNEALHLTLAFRTLIGGISLPLLLCKEGRVYPDTLNLLWSENNRSRLDKRIAKLLNTGGKHSFLIRLVIPK